MRITSGGGVGLILASIFLLLGFLGGCKLSDSDNLPEGSFKLICHPETYRPLRGQPAFDDIIGSMLCDRETRRGLAWEWSGPISFDVELPPNPVLAFEWAFSPDAARLEGLDFMLSATVSQGETEEAVLELDEKIRIANLDSIWQPVIIDLIDFKPGAATITFAFNGPSRLNAKDDFLIASPRIYSAGRTGFRRVILIGVDTLRADHLSCYGYGRRTTPTIDEWAEGGTVFSYCIAASPWTYPSFAAMHTGRYPSICGAVTNVRFLPEEETTLAEILSREGFVTFMAVNNVWTGPPVNMHQGFDTAIRFPVERADVTFESARSWLKTHRWEDTFAFIHFMDTHVPYRPIKPYNTMFDPDYSGRFLHEFKEVEEVRQGRMTLTGEEVEHLKALYDGEIAYLDEQFGKFLEFLEEEGMAEETLLIFTADHGEEFYEHGGFEHGHCLYDEMIWVPLIVSGPDIPAGRVDDRLASTMDIMPTILDHFDIAVPDNINGTHLLQPLPEGERMLIVEQLRYGEEQKGTTTPKYRYIYHTVSGEEELYDLRDDRGMLSSVAADRRATARSFRAFVTGYAVSTGSPWHVNFQRAGKFPAPYKYSGTITCPGGFAKVEKWRFIDDDILEVKGEKIEFDIGVRQGSEKEISFVTNDESAQVTFEIMRNGRPLVGGDIFIGPDLEPMAESVFELSPNDELFGLGQPILQRENHDGVFIWANPARVREQLRPDLTPEMIEELRSIGYLN